MTPVATVTVACESGCGSCHPASAFALSRTSLLGVVAGPHREELHELARVVFVGALAGRRRKVEVAQHRRICRDLHQHRSQVRQGHPPPGEVLPVHERVVGDLAVVAGEVAVPEQRHALRERCRRAEHVVEPPLLQLSDIESAAGRRRGGEGSGLGRACLDQPVDSLVEPVGQRRLQLRGRVSEAGAPQELHDARRLRTQWRDPVQRSSGLRFGQALHRSAQQANRANADSGGDSRRQGLAAGDASPDGNARGTRPSLDLAQGSCAHSIRARRAWHQPDVKNS